MGLEHVVVTSVARDDLPDGGRASSPRRSAQLRPSPGMGVEVLIPDFNGSDEPLRTVMEAGRTSSTTTSRRSSASRSRSASARAGTARCTSCAGPRRWPSRSGYPVHTKVEPDGRPRRDARRADRGVRGPARQRCDILTIGQYLRPTEQHLPLERYYHPDEFAEMKAEALALGFKHVESGPLVRSSATTPGTRCPAPS
jgi:lipoyl synthase